MRGENDEAPYLCVCVFVCLLTLIAQVCNSSRNLIAQVSHAVYVVNGSGATLQQRVDERLQYIRTLCPGISITKLTSRSAAATAADTFAVLDGAGDLDVDGIVSIVARLASLGSAVSVPLHEALVAERLVRFWRARRERLYLDRAAFYEHLTEAGKQRPGGCVARLKMRRGLP